MAGSQSRVIRVVPQDPTDQPASLLLDRIRAERATTDTLKKN